MGERTTSNPSDNVRSLRAGRRLALAAVFEAEFGQRTADAVLERHLAETEGDERAAALARDLVANVMVHRDTIDARVVAVAPQYPVSGLARMDRALLHARSVKCYTRRRHPGSRLPNGSSSPAPTVETRCGA